MRISNLNKPAKQFIEEAIRLYREHRYHESIEAFDRAIQIDPLSVRALHGKSAVLFKIKGYSKALKAYEQAVALYSNNAQIHADIAEVLFVLEDFSASGTAYRRAIELNVTYWEVYHKKTDLLRAKISDDDAEAAMLKHWLSLFIPDAEAAMLKQWLLPFIPDATKKADTTNNRKQDNYAPTFEGHWAYMGSVHPCNCRCPECWEP